VSDLARWTVADEGGVVVVALTGEVDLSNADDLEAELGAAVEGAAPAVVDLSGLDYLDSSGTRSLHRLAAAAAARRQPLALVAPPASTARRLLDLVGMAESVPVHDTVAEARTAVTG